MKNRWNHLSKCNLLGLGIMIIASCAVILSSGPIYSSLSKIGRVRGTEAIYTPGTYTSSAPGYDGDVKVDVTVSETELLELTFYGEGETPEIGGTALNTLQHTMLKQQTSEVDSIAGATFTSDAAIAAAGKALAEARGEAPEALAEDLRTADIVVTDAADVVIVPEVQGNYKDGTYTGTGMGNNGDITVEVVVEDGNVISIELIDHSETAGIYEAAEQQVRSTVIRKQTIEVDNVSGATYSLEGIRDAVANALKQAS